MKQTEPFREVSMEVGPSITPGERRAPGGAAPLNVLVLYDQNWVHVKTISEYLESFADYSAHRYWYAAGTHHAPCRMDLSMFDAVVIHYSVRLYARDFISPHVAAALRGYGGLKVLFIQDEYDVPNVTCDQIESLGLQVVFTCVPEPHIGKVYDPKRFAHVRFIETLTGWIPARLTSRHAPLPPTRRALMIAYRGRRLPYFYGRLGQEKLVIGQRMREICRERGIPCDIAWEDDDRIYGDAWYEFLGSARATLGSESGSQLFDWNGESRRWVEQALRANPDLSFEDAYERFLHQHDGRIEMNQISPRVFEAVALRTALILFEGNYSGIVQPDVHYIPLKKDFSNIDEVLAKLHDDEFIERITERAHQDVVGSGRYSYPSFIHGVDQVLKQELGDGAGRRLVAAAIGPRHEPDLEPRREDGAIVTAMRHHQVTNRPVGPPPPDAMERLGREGRAFARRFMPASLRRVLKPPLRHLWRSLRALQARWRARRQG